MRHGLFPSSEALWCVVTCTDRGVAAVPRTSLSPGKNCVYVLHSYSGNSHTHDVPERLALR